MGYRRSLAFTSPHSFTLIRPKGLGAGHHLFQKGDSFQPFAGMLCVSPWEDWETEALGDLEGAPVLSVLSPSSVPNCF